MVTAAPKIRWNRDNEKTLNEKVGDLRSDFRASQDSRFMARLTGVHHQGSGADYHYRYERDYLHMIERARHYERDNPVIGQGISRLAANVMQEGFSPDPASGSPDFNALAKDKWAEWAEESSQCHSEGEHSFRAIEELVFRSAIRDGDIFALPLVDGSLQLIEGHRPRTPRNTLRNVVHGILMDDRARRQELWVSKEDIGVSESVRLVSDISRVPWRDSEGFHQVFQVFFPKRTSQRRGYTALAPVSDTIGQSDDLFFTMLVKAQMNALIVLLEEQQAGGIAGVDGTPLGSLRETLVDGIPGIDSGLHVKVQDGRTIKGHAPAVPNAEFFTHANLLLTFIAVNLDIPVAVLLLDASNTNFSSWRGTIEQARIRFRYLQKLVRDQFHRPVYEWKVRQWLATDSKLQSYVTAGVNPLKHKWKIPGWPYIDPFKDAQADNLLVEKFLSSPRRVLGARGHDWAEVAPEIVADKAQLIELAIDAAEQINARYPNAGVTWREILGPGLSMAAAPMNPGQPEGAPE